MRALAEERQREGEGSHPRGDGHSARPSLSSPWDSGHPRTTPTVCLSPRRRTWDSSAVSHMGPSARPPRHWLAHVSTSRAAARGHHLPPTRDRTSGEPGLLVMGRWGGSSPLQDSRGREGPWGFGDVQVRAAATPGHSRFSPPGPLRRKGSPSGTSPPNLPPGPANCTAAAREGSWFKPGGLPDAGAHGHDPS